MDSKGPGRQERGRAGYLFPVGLLIGVIGAGLAIIVGGGRSLDTIGQTEPVPLHSAPIPGRQITNLQAAATAAGCVLINSPSEGREHVAHKVTYHTNPPSSGDHDPIPAADGIYAPGREPSKEHLVHTLEHGRIEIQYRPGTSVKLRSELISLWREPFGGTRGYHQLLFRNDTGMPYAVAAVAWTHILGCPRFTPGFFDAERAFRAAYTDKAPEQIP